MQFNTIGLLFPIIQLKDAYKMNVVVGSVPHAAREHYLKDFAPYAEYFFVRAYALVSNLYDYVSHRIL